MSSVSADTAKGAVPLADVDPKDRDQCKINTDGKTNVLQLKKGGKISYLPL